MMPVQRQPAPGDFEKKVGARGRRVLTKHLPQPPVASTFWKGKEHWTKALGDLMSAYGQIRAFSCFRIELVTGSRSVEHFKPKSMYPASAYDWDNFRLVCSLMNGRKGDHEDILDPFTMPARVFDLEPLKGRLLIHRKCPKDIRSEAQRTIDRLRLNSDDCIKLRQDHLTKILGKDWSLAEARRQSPFLVACLEEQGLL